jgi:hypothetical protein
LHAMPHLPPAQHETSNAILQRNKNKGKTTEMSRIQIQTSASQ